MNEKPNWTEWIRKSPAWLKGAIGLATAVIGFVVLIRSNHCLGIVISGTLSLVALFLTCVYLVFAKTPPLIEGGHGVYRFPKLRPWATGIAVLVVLSFLFIIAFQPSRSFVIAALIGTPTPTSTPIPTTTPLPEDGLRIADVMFDRTEEGQKVLDVKFRNIGSTVSFIKRAEIEINDSYHLEWLWHYSQQEVTWTGNVLLPNGTVIDMSQAIKAGETDRIQFMFYSDDLDVYDNIIYEIIIKFIYNETDEVLATEPITLLIPRQATILGTTGKSEQDWKAAVIANAAAIKRFLERETIKDPDFIDLAAAYEEAGRLK